MLPMQFNSSIFNKKPS